MNILGQPTSHSKVPKANTLKHIPITRILLIVPQGHQTSSGNQVNSFNYTLTSLVPEQHKPASHTTQPASVQSISVGHVRLGNASAFTTNPAVAFHKSRATATTCLRWVSLIPNITPTRSIHRDFWVIPISTALCYSTVQLVSYRNAEQNKWFVRSEPTQIQNVVVLVWWIPAHHRDVCCGSKC